MLVRIIAGRNISTVLPVLTFSSGNISTFFLFAGNISTGANLREHTSPHSFAARQADVRNGALIAGERDIDILHVIKDRRDAVDSDTQVFSPHGDHIFIPLD